MLLKLAGILVLIWVAGLIFHLLGAFINIALFVAVVPEPISKPHFYSDDHIFGYKALIPPRHSYGYALSGFVPFARKSCISLRKRVVRWVLKFGSRRMCREPY